MEKYPLWYENKQIGNVSVQIKGLYYCFTGVCNMSADISFRVRVHCGERITDLGICVPEDGSYIFRKRIAMKNIGEGTLKFFVEESKQTDKNLIPLFADKPFAGIDALENAKLLLKDSTYYIYSD